MSSAPPAIVPSRRVVMRQRNKTRRGGREPKLQKSSLIQMTAGRETEWGSINNRGTSSLPLFRPEGAETQRKPIDSSHHRLWEGQTLLFSPAG